MKVDQKLWRQVKYLVHGVATYYSCTSRALRLQLYNRSITYGHHVFDKMQQTKHFNRHLFSLLHKHQHHRKPIQQIHCHLLTSSNNENLGVLKIWNSVLKHYSLGTFPQEAIFLFKYLKKQQAFFDSFTYCYVIKACGGLKGCNVLGRQVHCLSTKVGFLFHVYVQTALVDMYVGCGCLVEAKNVFDGMDEKNLVTWNVLLTGFIKWGEIEFAREVFNVMPERNVVSWTGFIDGCTRVGRFHEALLLFRRMVVCEGIKPTEVTLLAIFPAIWHVGCLEFCQMVHAYGEKSGFNALDIRVMNCLIDAYAKSGSIESAHRAFEEIDYDRRNLVTWTSIISGFAMHGMAAEASDCYSSMVGVGLKPNRITFLSLLNAYSHGGLVDQGLGLYRDMVEVSEIQLDIKHYGTLIDMLGRAGRLEEAEKIALGIPTDIANVVVWRTLLGSCSFHGNAEIGERVTRKIMEMEREYGGDYVLLSNIFSGAGRFEDSENMRRAMDEQKASKVAGVTLV